MLLCLHKYAFAHLCIHKFVFVFTLFLFAISSKKSQIMFSENKLKGH